MRPRPVASNYPTVCLVRLNAPHWALRIRWQTTTDRLGRAGITRMIQNRQGFPWKKAHLASLPLPCVKRMAASKGFQDVNGTANNRKRLSIA